MRARQRALRRRRLLKTRTPISSTAQGSRNGDVAEQRQQHVGDPGAGRTGEVGRSGSPVPEDDQPGSLGLKLTRVTSRNSDEAQADQGKGLAGQPLQPAGAGQFVGGVILGFKSMRLALLPLIS